LSSRHVSRSSSDVGLAAMHLSGYSDLSGLIVYVAFAGGAVFIAVFSVYGHEQKTTKI